jgi:RHS repeat-associated protein
MLLPGYRRRLKLLQLRVNGNMTSAPGKTIAYNYDNMPKSMNGTTFVYDYSGHRVKKNSTVYIGKLYECTSGTCIKYIFAGSNRVAMKTGSTINYYHPDHLGSSSVMTDSSGIMKEEIYYYPFGKTRSNTGTLNVKHKFTGQELDDETGLYNYGARYYDPAIGRFVSADSIVPDFSDPQSLNRYSYCRNNPVIITDPSGNIFIIDDIIIAAVTYVVANAAVIAEGAAIGAAIGGASAAVTGGNVWQGMALGAVSGAVFAGVGGLIGDSITYAAVPGGVGPPTAGWAAAGNIGGAMAGGAASGASTAAMTGGNVGQGALIGMAIAGVAAAANVAYTEMVGYEPKMQGGEEIPGGKYKPNVFGQPPKGENVTGFNEKLSGDFWEDLGKQGSFFSKILNIVPGINGTAGLHDYWMNNTSWSALKSWGLMLPAAAVTYSGQLDGQLMPLTVQMFDAESRRRKD